MFLLSGAFKVGSSTNVLRTMRALRVPAVLRQRWIARVLPWGEIALASALLFGGGLVRFAAGIVACVALIWFTLMFVGVMRRHEIVDCGCFGALSSERPIDRWAIARNLGLLVLCIPVLLTPFAAPSLMGGFFRGPLASQLLLLLMWTLVGLCVALVQLRRACRNEFEAVPAPQAAAEIGDPIPDVELVDAAGVTLPLTRLGFGAPVFLLFLSGECGKCGTVAEHLDDWATRIAPVTIRVATSSRPDVVIERLPGAVQYIAYGASHARKALGVQRNPAAVVLGGATQPVVASGVAHGIDEILDLVSTLTRVKA